MGFRGIGRPLHVTAINVSRWLLAAPIAANQLDRSVTRQVPRGYGFQQVMSPGLPLLHGTYCAYRHYGVMRRTCWVLPVGPEDTVNCPGVKVEHSLPAEAVRILRMTGEEAVTVDSASHVLNEE